MWRALATDGTPSLPATRSFDGVAMSCLVTSLAIFLPSTFDAFGSERLMWGSDVTRLPCSYSECLDHFRQELPFLTDEDRANVLGGTAARLSRWP
jgi:predicted TIM-barrel fold metal-dependent hydrolase